ncbi:MAG: hypothetical protein ACW99R_03980 [Candidatus Hodarchaeales archaeon]|jgi:hypothetical protein
MKKKTYQIYIVGLALIALVFSGSSGFATQATLLAPEEILSDTLVGSDPFVEGLELIAAQESALIVQYYQYGGEKTFPLNPETSPFDNLDLLYIVSSRQDNWRQYWPRSIWEFRDGATVVFQFSQNLQASLEDAQSIVDELNPWMGTTLDVLYGVEVAGVTTLFYWGYLSAQNHSDFIINEFYDVLSIGGYTNFITNDVIESAPLSVVGTGLVKPANDWIPLAVTAFVLPDGIGIDPVSDVHTMSISDAFDYSGIVRPSPNALISAIEFRLPYVANVVDIEPATNSLYPELTGKFDWTLKAGPWQTTYEDISVIYDMAVEELETFPQITGDISVDTTALHSSTDPKLNYTITMTNTGDEFAYNTTFVWDLGDEEFEPQYISIFDSDNYVFDGGIALYYNYSSGLMVNEPVLTEYLHTPGVYVNVSLDITGWFTHLNGTPVQPTTDYNATSGVYNIDLESTMESVYVNKSFFNFKHSANIGTLYQNGTNYLFGTIDELPIGASEVFWWAIDDLPASDDTFIILGFDGGMDQVFNSSGLYIHSNITFIDNTSEVSGGYTNIKDWIVSESLKEGSDLRYPPIDSEFIPGVMFVYQDSGSREYFGWSNGLIFQLYDDEAILKITVSLNSTIYEVDEVAQIDVSIENIGDAIATNVQIQGFHAMMGPEWELRDLQVFTDEISVGTINPGETKTHSFLRNVSTFLGIHPVGFVIDYTTEEDEGLGGAFNQTEITDVASNLIIALVLPKSDKAGVDEPSYPTPVVNTSVSWYDENGGDIANGDIVEIRTEVKNLGDEPTTIKLFSYFPTRMASIDLSPSYNGKIVKVTDESGNVLAEYDQGYAFDHTEWPISIAAVAGIHLAPGATIIFYYKITVTDGESLIVPPVAVEYDSRYPMASTSGMSGASDDSGDGIPITSGLQFSEQSSETPQVSFRIQEGGSGSSWTSYSDVALLAAYAAIDTRSKTTTPPDGGVDGFTTLTSFIRDNMRLMIVVLAIPVVVLVIRERRRRI